MGRGGLTQRIALIDYRLQLAREDMLHHLMKLALRTHERTQERKLAREEEAEVEGGLRPGGGAAGYDLAAWLQRFHALLPGGLPDVLEDDIAHTPVGKIPHFLGNLLLVMVDDVIGPQLTALVELVFVAGGGDAGRT